MSQWERRGRHAEVVDRLVAGGHAYEDEGAIRLRVPDEGETLVRDVIRGDIAFPHAAIKDFVIRRSDRSEWSSVIRLLPVELRTSTPS